MKQPIKMSRALGVVIVAALLERTKEFASVVVGEGPRPKRDPKSQAPDYYPSAWLRPLGWKTEEEKGDGPGEGAVRVVDFEVTIATRPGEGRLDLEQLVDLAERSIEGQDLSGTCYPAWTTLRAGRYGPTDWPESTAVMNGRFAYPLPAQVIELDDGSPGDGSLPNEGTEATPSPSWWPGPYWWWHLRPKAAQAPGDGTSGPPDR